MYFHNSDLIRLTWMRNILNLAILQFKFLSESLTQK